MNRHCTTFIRAAGRLRCVLVLWALCALLPAGCRTVTLPRADLQAPGWSVRHGQAVWTKAANDKGVAGDILLATRADGACFVQFAKPPFTLATARTEAGLWSVETATARRRSSGRGMGPRRFVWFALAEEIDGRRAGCDWVFEAGKEASWRLSNASTGEALEGYLTP